MKASKNFPNYIDGSFRKNSKLEIDNCKFIENNFTASKHFYDRMFERGIVIERLVKTIKNGQKFYFIENNRLLVKYYFNRLTIVCAKCSTDPLPVLLTGFFFKKNVKSERELYRLEHLGNTEGFMFTEK